MAFLVADNQHFAVVLEADDVADNPVPFTFPTPPVWSTSDPTILTVSANAGDSDGTVSQVQFFAGATPTDTHREAARLAKRGLIRVFVTTNFDHLLERALEDDGITPVVISLAEQVEQAPPALHALPAGDGAAVAGDGVEGRHGPAPVARAFAARPAEAPTARPRPTRPSG